MSQQNGSLHEEIIRFRLQTHIWLNCVFNLKQEIKLSSCYDDNLHECTSAEIFQLLAIVQGDILIVNIA